MKSTRATSCGQQPRHATGKIVFFLFLMLLSTCTYGQEIPKQYYLWVNPCCSSQRYGLYQYQSAYNNQSGSYNINVGYKTGFTSTTNANNIHIGYEAGYDSIANDNIFTDEL